MIESEPAKKSDLGVRFVSAIVMIAIAGGALWAGGWIFTAFVGLIAIGLIWEWWGLVSKLPINLFTRTLLLGVGMLYILTACYGLVRIMDSPSHVMPGILVIVILLSCVVATDVGAYFAGRAIGGPKIAPAISPSKTWAGLAGGAFTSACVLLLALFWLDRELIQLFVPLAIGAGIAVIAQAGDFLESFVKRKANVKDSSNLIPGHGGLLDRMDGMLAVFFIFTIVVLASGGFGSSKSHDQLPQPVVESE